MKLKWLKLLNPLHTIFQKNIWSFFPSEPFTLDRSIVRHPVQEGIFFFIHSFARDVLVMEKLEIEKTKPTFIKSVLKVDIIKVA